MNNYFIKCASCGRFCGYEGTEFSTPFGNCGDTEPPDEEAECKGCVEKNIAYHTKAGWVPSPWIKAPWMYKVAKELGMKAAGPKGAAWSVFRKTDKPLEEDWEFVDD